MSKDFKYNITENLKSGVDFFGIPFDTALASISAQADLTVSTSKTAYASTSILIDSTKVTLGVAIFNASVSISASSSSSVSAEWIKNARTSISGESIAQSESEKTSYSQISTSSTLSTSPTAIKLSISHSVIESILSIQISAYAFRNVSSRINAQSTASATAGKLVKASASINPFTVLVILSKEIVNARTEINIKGTSILASLVKFASNGIIDTGNIRTLLYIDDKPITEHNRILSSSKIPVYKENINWNNKKSRYYNRQNTAAKDSFSISWSFLPNFREKTVDSKYARDYIASIAEDPDIHVLKIVSQYENSTTPYSVNTYNVFVRSYDETLVRRDMADGVYYFDCSIGLEEA